MANIYGDFTVDGDWNNALSWFDDAGLTIPALRIPGTGDFVYLLGSASISTGPSAPVTLIGFDSSGCSGVVASLSNLTIDTGGTLVVGNAGADHNWGGDASAVNGAVFSNSGQVYGNTGNNTVFNGTMTVAASTHGTGATFNDNAVLNTATVGDGATFNDNSSADSSSVVIGDNATFNDSAIFGNDSDGPTAGTGATFNNNVVVKWGTIGAGATFNNSAEVKYATIGAGATFNNSSFCSASGSGAVVGNDAVFNDDSYYDGGNSTCGENWTFNDQSSFRFGTAPDNGAYTFRGASFAGLGSGGDSGAALKSTKFFDASRPVTGIIGSGSAGWDMIWNSSGICGDSREGGSANTLQLYNPIIAYNEMLQGSNVSTTNRPTLGICSYRPLRPWAKMTSIDTAGALTETVMIDPSALADRQLET